jgi:pimeloyl-ACP methyl ester carboxylesterase
MKKHKLYLVPGFLTDKTIYKSFLEDDRFDVEVLEFISTLSKEETIESYASRLFETIDKTQPFSILGTSFGGLLAVEISKIVKPEKIIFVSSAKNRKELNPLMKVSGSSNLLDFVSDSFVKKTITTGYSIGKKLVTPIKEIHSEDIENMVNRIDGRLEKWIIKKINNWQGENPIVNYLHLHGDKDPVFPIKNIENCITIKGGTHNMIVNKSEEIKELVLAFLEK